MDYPVVLEGQIQGDKTTKISYRDRSAWPRIGGCPAYVALAAAAAEQVACPVTWVGSDELGAEYIATLGRRGVDVSAIETMPAKNSPMAIMAYQSDGSCACLYDPAFKGAEKLTDGQVSALRSASHLCITAGPPQLVSCILDCRSAGTRLYWVLKNDPSCFTTELCALLTGFANVIFCSRSEFKLIESVETNATVVETSGTGLIRVRRNERTDHLEIRPLRVRDATGAGDTFAGGYIAAEMQGVEDPVDAAAAGAAAAGEMLMARMELEQ